VRARGLLYSTEPLASPGRATLALPGVSTELASLIAVTEGPRLRAASNRSGVEAGVTQSSPSTRDVPPPTRVSGLTNSDMSGWSMGPSRSTGEVLPRVEVTPVTSPASPPLPMLQGAPLEAVLFRVVSLKPASKEVPFPPAPWLLDGAGWWAA
jgi:hypothetical protein